MGVVRVSKANKRVRPTKDSCRAGVFGVDLRGIWQSEEGSVDGLGLVILKERAFRCDGRGRPAQYLESQDSGFTPILRRTPGPTPRRSPQWGGACADRGRRRWRPTPEAGARLGLIRITALPSRATGGCAAAVCRWRPSFRGPCLWAHGRPGHPDARQRRCRCSRLLIVLGRRSGEMAACRKSCEKYGLEHSHFCQEFWRINRVFP